MTFKMPGKHTARIVQLTCSTSHAIQQRTGTIAGSFSDVEFDTIDGDSGHGVSLNATSHEITLSANRHYLGFGFFACNRGVTSDDSFQFVATDTSNNYLDADDGFFSLSLGYSQYGENFTSDDGTSRNPLTYSAQASTNTIFKIVKSVGGSDFTFKMRAGAYITSSGTVLTVDGTQLILLEME